jgi:hypothetical protein
MDNSFNDQDAPKPDDDLGEGIVSIGEVLTRRQRARLKPGDVLLGRYKIVGELGQGGMGLVFRCLDEVSGIEVAVKMLPPEVSRDSEEMEEVRDNFQLVSSLVHQHICSVRTLERDEANREYYLVMERVKGENLRRWRKRKGGKLTLEEVLPIIRQVAASLDYAHSRKVIHRDIKPSNVMVGSEGADFVKVLDFGLAAQIHTSFSRVSQTRYGTSGTGPYMAPEQWRGQYQDGKTDQYALAVLTYELLAGRCPFESHDTAVLREAVLNDPPAPIPGLPAHVEAALARALAKERKDRFDSCAEFMTALGGTRGGGKKDKGGATVGDRGALFLAWVAGLMLLVGGVYWAHTRYQTSLEKKADMAAELVEEARLDATAQAQLDSFQQAFDAALQKGQLEAAVSSLADFERLGGSPSAITDMQRRYDAAVSQEVRRRAVAAQLARRDAEAIADGPGMTERKREIERLWLIADRAEKAQDRQDAKRGYDAVLSEVRVLQEADKARVGATQAQSAAHNAEELARASGAETDAASRFQNAVKDAERGLHLFNAADFEGASNAWKMAREKFSASETWAVAAQAYQRARSEYIAVAAGVDRSLLAEYATDNWREAQTQAAIGEQSADQPVAGRNAYVKALVALNNAQADAQLRAPSLLVIEVSADGESVRGNIVEGTEVWNAGDSILLERGRSYTFSVSYNDPSGKRWSTAEVRKTADWLGEQRQTVRLEEQTYPDLKSPWENSLEMKFNPVRGTDVLFGVWEVRVRDYRQFVNATRRSWSRPPFAQGATHPAVNVSWDDAVAFCEWLTQEERSKGLIGSNQAYRLPRDWEWSVAVGLDEPSSGTPQTKHQKNLDVYPWVQGLGAWPPPSEAGNYAPRLGVDQFPHTAPVGSFDANANGLYDLGGNVWEWCEDFFDGLGGNRVLRGGSWGLSDAGSLRSSYRGFNHRGARNDVNGFRVVLGVTSP